MKGWVLTTCVRESPDPYTDRVLPLTRPTHERYADTWGMEYDPHTVTRADEAWMAGTVASRLGTMAVYAGWPHRMALLEDHAGIVYIDEDAPFLNYHRDLCTEVTETTPIGMVGDLTGALMVVKSSPSSRLFLKLVWEMREEFKWAQWAEEGAIKKLMGWEHVWVPGTMGAKPVAETEWTSKLRLIPGALCHPGDPNSPVDHWIACNPGGMHPVEARIDLIEKAIRGEIPHCLT